YQAAVLAQLCRRVYTIERHKPLLQEAEQRFRQLRIHNVTAKVGDGSRGWPEQAPFERIMVTAAAHDIPPVLVDQLAVGGIMVLPLGDAHALEQDLIKIIKTQDGLHIDHLGPVRFVPLVEGLPED
ncbi:MAG TPA: protein-L-isoaspartate O-methyltransferase, partial [Magnetospirillum sp.]|nr:protein-L-isoaspartate O-methyltransferase [Magnetospirillum sp.]